MVPMASGNTEVFLVIFSQDETLYNVAFLGVFQIKINFSGRNFPKSVSNYVVVAQYKNFAITNFSHWSYEKSSNPLMCV
jgi:hypothetical protein